MMFRVVAVLACVVLCLGQQDKYKEVMLPAQGTVRGMEETDRTTSSRTITSFKGIPYAKELNESSRFMPPEDPERFKSSPLDAFQSRPCLQITPFDGEQVMGSENCLTLDVYTQKLPTSGSRPYPVVVYLPGGRFRYGSSATFGFRYLLDKEVVLVVVNYRLGVYGFLSTEDAASPGNYGLMDQQKALQWIKTNIHLFGGDRDRITLFGHDSGAASISLHLLNTKSNDLFRQAILSGGSVLNPWAFQHKNARLHANDLGYRLGCDTSSSYSLVQCLRHRKPEDVVRETNKVKNITFLPVVDKRYGARDPFVDEDPITSLLEGKARPLPLVLGMTKEEGSMEFFEHYQELSRDAQHPLSALTRYLTPYLHPHVIFDPYLPAWQKQKLEAIAKGVLFVYFKNVQATDWNKSKKNWIEAISDFQFRSGMEMLGRLVNARNQSNTYIYQLEYNGPYSYSHLLNNRQGDPADYGTTHMDDVFYYFNTLYDSRMTSPVTSQDTTYINALRGNFRDIVAYFATNGQLFPVSLQYLSNRWTPYGTNESVLRMRREEGQTMKIEVEGRFRTHQLDFFSSFVKDLLTDDSSHVFYEHQETNQHYKSATWGLLGLCIVLGIACVALAAVFLINRKHSNKEAKFKKLATAPPVDGHELK